MQMGLFTVSLLLGLASPGGAQDEQSRPVSKVISLLRGMESTLKKEAEDDEAIYDKMACWCQTNKREKEKAVAAAEASIQALHGKEGDAAAGSGRLNSEVKDLEQEVAANQHALDEATALRKEQKAEFTAEEKDLVESIRSLKAAVTVLSKHHSFLQMESSTNMVSVAATLQRVLKKNERRLVGVLAPSQRRKVESFLQAYTVQPAIGQGYAAQSGEIFGVLSQMLESFESNLSQAQKDELANQNAYDELKGAKEEEIAAGNEQLNQKTDELAAADSAGANAKKNAKDTKANLAADKEFLAMLNEKCKLTDDEWGNRQKTRAQEMEAVSKALAVLTTGDSHDLFTRTLDAAFLQAKSRAQSQQRSQASALLAALAKKDQSPRLSALATQVQLAPLLKVKEAINKMVEELLAEKAVEIKKKDECVADLHENDKDTEDRTRKHESTTAKIADLTAKIDDLTAKISDLSSQVTEAQHQIKIAGEDREKANAEFHVVLNDQRETQAVLQKVKQILAGYYQEKANALLQAGEDPPQGFSEYKDQDGNGVIKMLETIITDTKAMETEAIRDEEDAQKTYEDYLVETNKGIDDKNALLETHSHAKATAEEDLVEEQQNKKDLELELTQLSNTNADLHKECDFTLKNFDLRQAARDDEVAALRRAMDILNGADLQAAMAKA